MIHKLTLLSICLLLLPLTLHGCGQEKTAAPSHPPEVEVAEVIQKDVPIEREWVATMDGLVNATILAQVEGYLIKQNYKEGDAVRKGDILFEIDPKPFQASLDEAKAVLARQEAVLQTARATLKRIVPLAKANAVSQKDKDDATGMVKAGEAEVLAARAGVRNAELALGFTKIASPIDGIAGTAKAQIGDLVGPTQTQELTMVSTVDPIKVYVPISEREYLEFVESRRKGADDAGKRHFSLFLADGSRWPYRGRFSYADRHVDPQTGTIRVAVLFPNPDNTLRPGQFAKLQALLSTEKNALLVPQRAVGELQGSDQVAVVGKDNTVHTRNVKVGGQFKNLVVIREGLKPGDRVVVEGTQKVKDGARVSPKPYKNNKAAEAK